MSRFAANAIAAAAAVAVLVLCALACGGAQSEDRSRDPDDEEDGDDSEPMGKREAAEADRNDGKLGGWRWKGKRRECYYVVANRCFKTELAACEAAKCGEQGCLFNESAPIKVRCANAPDEDERAERATSDDDRPKPEKKKKKKKKKHHRRPSRDGDDEERDDQD